MTSENSQELPLSSVQPGAELAAAVLGADGQVLMTAGSILTESALKKLAERGVLKVLVELPRDEAESLAAREALRQRLLHLFRACDLKPEHGAARELFEAVLDYRTESLR